MTHDQVREIIGRLRSRFPEIDREQALKLTQDLIVLPYRQVTAAVSRYSGVATTFNDSVLMSWIRAEKPTAVDRHDDHYEERLRARWAEEDELVDAMPDWELERAKAAALTTLSADQVTLLEKIDARKSRTLKRLIFAMQPLGARGSEASR